MTNFYQLTKLGWRPFFQQQLSLDEWENKIPARVIAQHKTQLELANADTCFPLEINTKMPPFTVGDWLLLNSDNSFYRQLERFTCLKRKAAGTAVDTQLIAANIDTVFIVSSLNEDFNLNRIERYLSLAFAAGVEPVVVLTKTDLVDNYERYSDKVKALSNGVSVVYINAHLAESTYALSEWLGVGKTVAFLGSSGVGKSTLTNTLLGRVHQVTGDIRQNDAKGRHTTTSKSLLTLSCDAMIIDTPGLRELQITDCQQGISAAFADITSLASNCRFSDCSHTNEPNCAVLKAIDSKQLDARRLASYLKLLKEESQNSASLSEKRAKDKALGKFYKRTLVDSYKIKGRN